ncbi:PhnD/SsuA/transferrin family substrate-binding protein [Thermithiobacillus plumbiphilus]|uniref:PhnD/SsuA/transferrin family substrate-binding protein n=1 Tax=Thermithiobacillus plumbiphilus TaxID=1729899 RepID=A0ABU9D4U1_9PROT
MDKRRFLHHLVGTSSLLVLAPGSAFAQVSLSKALTPLRIGLTPVFLEDQTALLQATQAYLEYRLGRTIQLVQRSSYGEILSLLFQNKLDFAWICGYPFVHWREYMRLLAVPLFHGQPLYQSYFIVSSENRTTQSLLDLRGKLFAYSDPNSNSGYLVPQYKLWARQEDPRFFFKKAIFTWAHRAVVEAVAAGLVDGGAVDGYVYDTLALLNPDLVHRTRVVTKSEKFGFPPIVASTHVNHGDFLSLQNALLAMHRDPHGIAILRQFNLDGFIVGSDRLYNSINHMMRFVNSKIHAA